MELKKIIPRGNVIWGGWGSSSASFSVLLNVLISSFKNYKPTFLDGK